MNQLLKIAAAGSLLGFLGAVGIYYDPVEPYPGFITAAGTLGGATIALLVATVVTGRSSLLQCFGWGAVLGLLSAATVFLAKGGWASWDAPFVLPTGVVTGAILGLIVRFIRRRAA